MYNLFITGAYSDVSVIDNYPDTQSGYGRGANLTDIEYYNQLLRRFEILKCFDRCGRNFSCHEKCEEMLRVINKE